MTVTETTLDQRLQELRQEFAGLYAPAGVQQDVSRLTGWRRKLQLDDSFGRMLNGPQWISGTSVRDGAITADKLEANLVISNLFTTSSTGTGARVEFDANGIRLYDSGNVLLVDLNAAGTMTFQSAASGARTVLDGTSFRQYRAAGTLVSELKNDGSGFLGSTGGTSATAALSWDTTPATTMKGTITIGAGGKLIDGDGSYWDSTGITLVSAGVAGDCIIWKVSGSTKGYITADAASMFLNYQGGAGIQLQADRFQVGLQTPGVTSLGPYLRGDGSDDEVVVTNASGTESKLIQTNGYMKLADRFYPGNAGAVQSTVYIDYHSVNTALRISGAAVELTDRFYPGNGGSVQTSVYLDYDAGVAAARFSGSLESTSRFLFTSYSQGSANDLDLNTGNFFAITGTTTINRISKVNWTSGSIIILQFSGSLTVTHNAASGGNYIGILLAGAVNFSATANDTLTLAYNGTNWVEVARSVI